MYEPTPRLLEGIRRAFPLQLFPWDDYFPRMAESDWRAGRADLPAVKSFFVRQGPFGGSHALLGGITAALRGIVDLRFDDPAFRAGMLDMGYEPAFVDVLASRARLRLRLFAPPEGAVFFPGEPVVTVVGPLADLRLAEGVLTEALNFPSLSLTKWYRLVRTVRPGRVLEFGRRRAQHPLKATLWAMLAGCTSTSHSEMRRFFDVRVSGTMGHEWVQSFGDVAEAFDTWLTHQPGKPIGLVDTKQCLEHDFPAWLRAVSAHADAIKASDAPHWGWRNDSGDLAYLTIEQYVRFLRHPLGRDPWFRDRMVVVLTNELDEYAAKSIIEQIRSQAGAAGFDAEDIIRRIMWAAGTRPSTCEDQPSLGGVAKLMEVGGHACIKLAFDAQGLPGAKTSIPGFNRSALVRDADGEIACLLIYPAERYTIGPDGRLLDRHAGSRPVDPLLARHPDNASLTMELTNYVATPQQRLVCDTLDGGPGLTAAFEDPTIEEVARRVQSGVDGLHWSMTRLDKPHPIKVSVTGDLYELRRRMIRAGTLREDKLPVASGP